MVRITKVYTRTGDKGNTHLAGGQPIAKTAERIEAYGCVDELNSQLGLVAEAMRDVNNLTGVRGQVLRIQNALFDLGSQLAVLPEDRRKNTPVVNDADVKRLEDEIDEMNEELPALTSFILPGGGEISARLHVARTVCRRCEREIIRLANIEELDGIEIPYVNRLSDWLFVASRYAAHLQKIEETLWKPGER